MNKKELYQAIYFYFSNVVYAYYLSEGKSEKEYFKYALEELKEKAKNLGLTAGADRDGEDIILFVEKAEEYTVVSTRLNIYTYEDEEMEAQ